MYMTVSMVFAQATATIPAKATTSPTGNDVDDAAIWIHPTDPLKSVVVINDKGPDSTRSGLYVYNLNGVQLQKVSMHKPLNPDVRYNVKFDNVIMDVLVCIDQESNNSAYNKVHVFKIDPAKADASSGFLTEITASAGISTGQTLAYGHGLYKRPSDGALFSVVSPYSKNDFTQIQLQGDGTGKVKGTQVRKWGGTDIGGDVCEGICCDDELGYIYICDENIQILKYWADPDKNNNTLVSSFAKTDGIAGDREEINIYRCDNNTGYILMSSQGNDQIKVYDRVTNDFKGTLLPEGMKDCDGVDVTAIPAGTQFPHGFAALHLGTIAGSSYSFYDWSDIAAGLSLNTPCDAVRPVVSSNTANQFSEASDERMIRVQTIFNQNKKLLKIHLFEKGKVTVTLFDLHGKKIKNVYYENARNQEQTFALNGNELLSGVYIVEIVNGFLKKAERVVIKR
jgi:3-phytase